MYTYTYNIIQTFYILFSIIFFQKFPPNPFSQTPRFQQRGRERGGTSPLFPLFFALKLAFKRRRKGGKCGHFSFPSSSSNTTPPSSSFPSSSFRHQKPAFQLFLPSPSLSSQQQQRPNQRESSHGTTLCTPYHRRQPFWRKLPLPTTTPLPWWRWYTRVAVGSILYRGKEEEDFCFLLASSAFFPWTVGGMDRGRGRFLRAPHN